MANYDGLNLNGSNNAKSEGENLLRYAEKMQSTLNSLSYIKKTLNNVWKGDAADLDSINSNTTKSEEYYNNKIIPSLNKLGSAVITMAESMEVTGARTVDGQSASTSSVTDLGVDLSNKTLNMDSPVNRSRVDLPDSEKTNAETVERFNNPVFGGNSKTVEEAKTASEEDRGLWSADFDRQSQRVKDTVNGSTYEEVNQGYADANASLDSAKQDLAYWNDQMTKAKQDVWSDSGLRNENIARIQGEIDRAQNDVNWAQEDVNVYWNAMGNEKYTSDITAARQAINNATSSLGNEHWDLIKQEADIQAQMDKIMVNSHGTLSEEERQAYSELANQLSEVRKQKNDVGNQMMFSGK